MMFALGAGPLKDRTSETTLAAAVAVTDVVDQ
jgi:hypothetical protein